MRKSAGAARGMFGGLVASGLAVLASGVVLAREPVEPAAVVDVQFGGGTLAEYYDLLRTEAPGINVIVPPSAEQVKVPKLSLAGVSVHDALMLPEFVCSGVVLAVQGGGVFVDSEGMDYEAAPMYIVQLPMIAPPPSNRGVTVEFPGGEVTDYLSTVEGAAGASRVVAMRGVERFEMPQVTLTGVTVEEAIGVVAAATPKDPGRDAFLDLTTSGSVIIVRVVAAPSASMALRTHVWSLAEPLERSSFSADDMLTAVETALTLGPDKTASIKYHEETRLLIVRGTDEDLKTVDTVLDGLDRSSSEVSKSRERGVELEYRIREAEVELEHLHLVRQDLEVAAEQLEVLVGAGQASQGELSGAQARLHEVSGKIQLAELRLQQAREMAEAAEGAAAIPGGSR